MYSATSREKARQKSKDGERRKIVSLRIPHRVTHVRVSQGYPVRPASPLRPQIKGRDGDGATKTQRGRLASPGDSRLDELFRRRYSSFSIRRKTRPSAVHHASRYNKQI